MPYCSLLQSSELFNRNFIKLERLKTTMVYIKYIVYIKYEKMKDVTGYTKLKFVWKNTKPSFQQS